MLVDFMTFYSLILKCMNFCYLSCFFHVIRVSVRTTIGKLKCLFKNNLPNFLVIQVFDYQAITQFTLRRIIGTTVHTHMHTKGASSGKASGAN
jgi:hypothetical protein